MEEKQQTSKVQHFFGLPLELRFRIISYLDIKSHIVFRDVSQDFNSLSNMYWQSELRKIIFKAESSFLQTTEVALMHALKIGTDVYVGNGYETKFWDCLLSCLLHKGHTSIYNISQSTFQEFLLTFYHLMDNLIYHEFPQYFRSMYIMQVLHLLKCFPTSQLSIRPSRIGLNIHVVIEDLWLGLTYELSTRKKMNFIPVALAELLYSYRFQRTSAFANVYEGHCFTYGFEYKKRKRHFHTEFDVYIEGTEELKTYIEAWLCSPDDCVYFPRRIFIEYFRFGLKIEVKGHVKNLWPQKIFLELE